MAVFNTTILDIRPECVDDFVTTLAAMFAVTKTHEGFIDVRLLKSEHSETEFIILQEWETVEHHLDYVEFRRQRQDLDRLMAMTARPPQIHYWNPAPIAADQR